MEAPNKNWGGGGKYVCWGFSKHGVISHNCKDRSMF